MIESDRLQSLAQLNQEMTDISSKLQNAVEKEDKLETERLKALIIVLQKKISDLLH